MSGSLRSQVQVALIGCGNLGKIHAGCLAHIPQARLRAYADVLPGSADRFLQSFGGDYATADVERVLSDPAVDAVYICTRHDSHAPLAIRAAQARKHVLIEKPMALTRSECDAVVTAVREAGVHLMPAFKMRYYPLSQKAREFIPKPEVLFGQIIKQPWSDTRWDQAPEQGGGNVLSQGCHGADLIRFFAESEVVHVHAVGGTHTHPGHSFPDQCMASLRLADGRGALWVQGDAGAASMTSAFFFQLFASGRSVQLWDRLTKATFTDRGRVWTEERPEEEGFQLENIEFISALLEGRAPTTDVHDGAMATRIPLAAIESIRTGQVLPP
ncbi:MAG: Gfo/Idh/MocA family oxidoreductase [Planctomycetes bacterium]|nr:Gfo/Idh/MocA family oxidoreductase [Planctomycetota bacterium]